jgi:hypothetical protein
MSHGPEHQIEHAEHAAHAKRDRFDKQVTISIAAIAAVLACVAMLSHRTHNQTLQLQNEAGRQSTEAANKWAYYQSKNLFYFEAKLMLDQMKVFGGKEESQGDTEKVRAHYQAIVDKYDKKLPEIEKEANGIVEKGNEYFQESHHAHARADRYDYGELGLQLAVVLCSLAILTKSRGFWLAGLVSALIGVLIALTGLFGLFLSVH